MESGSLKHVPKSSRPNTSDFPPAAGMEGRYREAAASGRPSGARTRTARLQGRLPLWGGGASGSSSRSALRAFTEGWVPMGNALPLRLQFLRRPASHHFSPYFARQPSSSLERRPRGGRKAHGHPRESSLLGRGADPAPPYPPFPASGRQPGRPRRGSQQSSGFCCICRRRAAGGDCNKGTDKKPW